MSIFIFKIGCQVPYHTLSLNDKENLQIDDASAKLKMLHLLKSKYIHLELAANPPDTKE